MLSNHMLTGSVYKQYAIDLANALVMIAQIKAQIEETRREEVRGPDYALMYCPDSSRLPYVEIDNMVNTEGGSDVVNLLAASIISDPDALTRISEETCVYATKTGDLFIEFLSRSPTNNYQFDGAATFQLFISNAHLCRNIKAGNSIGSYVVALANSKLRKLNSRINDDVANLIIMLVKSLEQETV